MKMIREGECVILIAREAKQWHLSISCAKRDPTWEEIKKARYEHMPKDIMVAMLLPPPEQYVNLHGHCFHLWEVDDARLGG
jgi:hypothetical protein